MMATPLFPRKAILAAVDYITQHIRMNTHAKFDGFILDLGAQDIMRPEPRYIKEKANRLKEYLLATPDARTPEGNFMADEVVQRAAALPDFGRKEPLLSALASGGFTTDERGHIVRMLPEVADLTAADDEVHVLLKRLNLTTAAHHLDEAIRLHGLGKWSSANGELRKVAQEIFDQAAVMLGGQKSQGASPGPNRRQLLANLQPPFLFADLGEWTPDGKNFVEGVFKRLNPGGHPGISEEEDCTFQLHLVLIVARMFLRRLKDRVL